MHSKEKKENSQFTKCKRKTQGAREGLQQDLPVTTARGARATVTREREIGTY